MAQRSRGWDVLCLCSALSAAPGVCPDRPVRSIASSALPVDVCIPDGFTDPPVIYFDDYSWRAFLAMVWPAAPGRRGVRRRLPHRRRAGTARLRDVQGAFGGVPRRRLAAPAEFQAYDAAERNACKVKPEFGDVVLASFNGIEDVGQAGTGELAGPLAAQNGRYVRYQTLYNRTAFEFIVRNRYYLRANLPKVPSPRPVPPVMEFPMGSVVIKAAWLDMAGFPADQVKRYYTRPVTMRDPVTGACGRVTAGLVGLHIIQKTPSRPQWIWSSFEQIDNVPALPVRRARSSSLSTTAANRRCPPRTRSH